MFKSVCACERAARAIVVQASSLRLICRAQAGSLHHKSLLRHVLLRVEGSRMKRAICAFVVGGVLFAGDWMTSSARGAGDAKPTTKPSSTKPAVPAKGAAG